MKQLSLEDVRSALWFWPAVAVVVAYFAAVGLVQVQPPPEGALAERAWPGDAAAASTVLQVIATSVITVTSLTFSLVVVALQLASQQFSPRLLREFARDWVIQAVLAVLIATFVFALTVLRSLDAEQPLPSVAVLVAYALALLAVAALLTFLAHIVRSLRVDTMLVAVHTETAATIARFYPPYDAEDVEAPGAELPGPLGGTLLTARRSGFLQVVDMAGLVDEARKADVLLRLHLSPGDHVIVGTPLAAAWPASGAGVPAGLRDRVEARLETGYERTAEQDVGLGLRLLADIAVKALSPSVNDPTTAGHAIGYAADLLVRLCDRRQGAMLLRDRGGVPRVVLRDRDFAYYVDMTCDQVRRYARNEPSALIALLRLLRAVATAARDDVQRDAVARQADLVAAETDEGLAERDREQITDMRRRVDLALVGDLSAAYVDTAGETRSG